VNLSLAVDGYRLCVAQLDPPRVYQGYREAAHGTAHAAHRCTMETISSFDLAFVVGGAGAATKKAPAPAPGPDLGKFAGQVGGDVVDAAEGCAGGAVAGFFHAGPHGAAIGCAVGAGKSAIGDIISAIPGLGSLFNSAKK
jgi:hypothetical protein